WHVLHAELAKTAKGTDVVGAHTAVEHDVAVRLLASDVAERIDVRASVHAHADELGRAGRRIGQELGRFSMSQVGHDLKWWVTGPERDAGLQHVLEAVDATSFHQLQERAIEPRPLQGTVSCRHVECATTILPRSRRSRASASAEGKVSNGRGASTIRRGCRRPLLMKSIARSNCQAEETEATSSFSPKTRSVMSCSNSAHESASSS